jgi:hypothetical protein
MQRKTILKAELRTTTNAVSGSDDKLGNGQDEPCCSFGCISIQIR